MVSSILDSDILIIAALVRVAIIEFHELLEEGYWYSNGLGGFLLLYRHSIRLNKMTECYYKQVLNSN